MIKIGRLFRQTTIILVIRNRALHGTLKRLLSWLHSQRLRIDCSFSWILLHIHISARLIFTYLNIINVNNFLVRHSFRARLKFTHLILILMMQLHRWSKLINRGRVSVLNFICYLLLHDVVHIIELKLGNFDSSLINTFLSFRLLLLTVDTSAITTALFK